MYYVKMQISPYRPSLWIIKIMTILLLLSELFKTKLITGKTRNPIGNPEENERWSRGLFKRGTGS